MDRNALLEMLFLFLIVFDGSDASLGWEFRKLAGVDPKDNGTATAAHDSPSPNPLPGDKKSDSKPIDELGKNTKDPPPANTTQKVDPKGSNNIIPPVPPPVPKTDNGKMDPKESNNTTPASPVPATKSDVEKSHEKEKENEGQTFSQSDTNENCNNYAKCNDEGHMAACISKIESKYLVVLVQNGGDSAIKVKLFMENNLGDIEVAKHLNKKINISVTSGGSTQLTLNAGKGDCVLHMGTHVPEGIFLRLPSYDKLLTPVNGAYFLILTVLILGATWACCKFRKKRPDAVPYQELEMAMPESASAMNVESVEGWDQDWDDDWDENVAVKSPVGNRTGSISANGLTSRTTNREGWENERDE